MPSPTTMLTLAALLGLELTEFADPPRSAVETA